MRSILLFLCCFALASEAGNVVYKEQTKRPKGCKSESSCFAPLVTWRVRQGSLDDVCHNYAFADWRYRACRTEAGKLFKQKCQQLKRQEKESQGKMRDTAIRQQDIYCVGYRP